MTKENSTKEPTNEASANEVVKTKTQCVAENIGKCSITLAKMLHRYLQAINEMNVIPKVQEMSLNCKTDNVKTKITIKFENEIDGEKSTFEMFKA